MASSLSSKRSGGGGGGSGSGAAAASPTATDSASLSPSASGRTPQCCRFCGDSSRKILNCVACAKVAYCDKTCQLLDWENGHRDDCRALKLKKDAMDKDAYRLLEPPAPRRPKLVGLENIGNTCFMAASLQMLASVWPLTVYYLRKEYDTNGDLQRDNPLGTAGAMTEAYAEMVKDLILTNKKVVAPHALMTQVRSFQSRFEGFSQHDAQELIMFLMDGLHEDCNRGFKLSPKPVLRDMLPGESDLAWGRVSWEWYNSIHRSAIVDLFMGQFRSAITCPECKHRSVRFDPYNVINLPMPGSSARTVDVLLRRSAPGLLAPEAFELPLPGARAEVLRAWDEIAAFAGPNELYELQLPLSCTSVPAGRLLAMLGELAGVDAARLVLTKDGRVLSPKMQLPLAEEQDAPLVASEVAPAEWLQPGAPAPSPEEDARMWGLARVHAALNNIGAAGGGAAPAPPQFVEGAASLESPGWEKPPQFKVKKKGGGGGGDGSGGGGGGGGGGVAADAAPFATTASSAAELSALHQAIPPARRQLVLLELWSRLDSVAKDTVAHVGPGHGWEPARAFTQNKPANFFTVALSLPAGASLAVLRLHAAAALLPVLGGLRAMRKVLSSKLPHNHKAHFDTQGGKIPGHLVLLEMAQRLPLCSPAAYAKGSSLTWAPTLVLEGVTGAYAQCGEGAAAGCAAAGQFPLELCGSKAHGLAVDRDGCAEMHFAAQRVAVALRGVVYNGTLKKDVMADRFPVSLSSQAQRKEAAAEKSLRDCFFQHQLEEQMEEGNFFTCSQCAKSVPVRKKHDVWRLPKYLVLNLKRYGTRLTKKGLHTQKSTERVAFPLVGLDLSEFNGAARAEFGDGPETTARSIYDCVAAVQQHGQMKGGHCAFSAPGEGGAVSEDATLTPPPHPHTHLFPPTTRQTPPSSTSRRARRGARGSPASGATLTTRPSGPCS